MQERGKTVRAITGIIAVLAIVLVAIFSGMIWENVDAEQIKVIQAPISGELVWYTMPGVKLQKWGKVTTYFKRSIYRF